MAIVIGAAIVVISLLFTNDMARHLREKEQHDVELWARAMERVNRDAMGDYMGDPLIGNIINNRNNIPFIITDENLNVISSHLIPDHLIDNPQRLRRVLDRFASENTPIVIHFWWTNDHNHIIFYGQSRLLKSLYYFPYIQILVIIIFGVMINQIVYYNNIEKFIQVGMVFLYVTIFGGILYYLIYEMYADVWNGINGNMRRSMFRHLQRLTAEELVRLDHGETVGMVKYWTMDCVNFVVRNIVHNINNILKIEK